MTANPMTDGAGAAPTTIDVNGSPVTVRAGQTVGAALVSVGITSWRLTRGDRKPRGLFCGIGICFDCLIEVDGVPGQRACLVPVRDGMQVTVDSPGGNR